MSAGQVSQSFANRNSAPLFIRVLCLAVGFAAILLGLDDGDHILALSGFFLGAVFALAVVKDCGERIHLWLLYDMAENEGGDS
jgi:hypothetical protein